MTDTMTEPTHLVLVNGVSSDELLTQFKAEVARWTRYHGAPILPAGWDVKVVDLRPARIEPDIEDEP